MKNRNRFRILLAMMLVCLMGKSQTWEPVLPTVIPPAPESAALEKFMGYPVSPATGLVDISVPLHVINCYDLSIPIQLKYHSSGIKIQDPAGSVGRGWALTPGFKITRTVMGKPDERFPVKENLVPSHSTVEDEIWMAPNSGTADCSTSSTSARKYMDGQYDIFRIHLPSIEASFILKHVNGNPTIQMIPDRPWKITPLISPGQNTGPATLYGFEVQDDQGIRYLFGETALPSQPNSANYSEASTGFAVYFYVGWALREIIFPNQQKVTFTYQRRDELYPDFNHTIAVVDNEEVVSTENQMQPKVNSITPAGSGYAIIENSTPGYNLRYTSLVPISVTTPAETIHFSYNSSNMLSGMTVTNKQNVQVRSVVCTHNATQKLLKTVSINGKGKYQFDYDLESNTQIDSGGFDWWGFYNGQTSRPAIPIPNLTLSVTPTPNLQLAGARTMQVGKGANRTPNETYMTARALTKITYPTGGTFKINYEAHRFKTGTTDRIGAGLRVKSTESYDPQFGKTTTKRYEYGTGNFTGVNYPDEKTLVTSSYLCKFDAHSYQARQRVITVFSRQPYFNSSQLPVWYSHVTEITPAGKTEYNYLHTVSSYAEDNTLGPSPGHHYNDYQITSLNHLSYPEPVLKSETMYELANGQYKVARMTENTYQAVGSPLYVLSTNITRRKIGSNTSNCNFLDKSSTGRVYYDIYGSPVSSRRYSLSTATNQLVSTKTTDYLANGQVINTANYTYVASQPYHLRSKSVNAADGNVYKEEYYYSGEVNPDFAKMTTMEQLASTSAGLSHFRTLVWQQINSVNEKRVSSAMHIYGIPVTGLYRPAYSYYQVGEGSFEKRTEFQHDTYGNLRYARQDNQKQTVYIWGYNGLYPVAMIENASFDQVKAIIPEATLNSYTAAATPSTAFINALAQLRTQLPEASVTLLQYTPGVGVTRIESPRAIPSGFTYDSGGRLIRQTISDTQTERKVQEYEYNYINQ